MCSVYVMMNKKTRKLSKFIEETREETKAVFMDCDPIIDADGKKLRELNFETADYVRTGLSVCVIFPSYLYLVFVKKPID